MSQPTVAIKAIRDNIKKLLIHLKLMTKTPTRRERIVAKLEEWASKSKENAIVMSMFVMSVLQGGQTQASKIWKLAKIPPTMVMDYLVAAGVPKKYIINVSGAVLVLVALYLTYWVVTEVVVNYIFAKRMEELKRKIKEGDKSIEGGELEILTCIQEKEEKEKGEKGEKKVVLFDDYAKNDKFNSKYEKEIKHRCFERNAQVVKFREASVKRAKELARQLLEDVNTKIDNVVGKLKGLGHLMRENTRKLFSLEEEEKSMKKLE